MSQWELRRWDLHRIRRALQRAIEADAEAEAGTTRGAKKLREVALWRELDDRLAKMLLDEHEQRHGAAEGPEDPDDLIG